MIVLAVKGVWQEGGYPFEYNNQRESCKRLIDDFQFYAVLSFDIGFRVHH